jgi:hypothetical protein
MDQKVEEELKLFQREGVIRLWTYEGEPRYQGSLFEYSHEEPLTVSDSQYRNIIQLVDKRLEKRAPDDERVRYRTTEDMLLEQVVFRRQFFAEATCGALSAGTLADSGSDFNLYRGLTSRLGDAADVLVSFFDAVHVPSLLLLDVEDYLTLRDRSNRVLREIVDEVYLSLERAGGDLETAKAEAVDRLVQRYSLELKELLKRMPSSSHAGQALDSAEGGTSVVSMESHISLFLIRDPIENLSQWYSQLPDGRCKLALLLLRLKSGTGNSPRPTLSRKWI